MDKNQGNRTNQCNPNNAETGPGHTAGYDGSGTKADLDNHANQMNPNSPNQGNRTNQCNPNNAETGPGRTTGYDGLGTKADLDNHANQMNPNDDGENK